MAEPTDLRKITSSIRRPPLLEFSSDAVLTGRLEWKDSKGRSLREIQEQRAAEAEDGNSSSSTQDASV